MSALQELSRADILFLNWRDPGHPRAGGAEAYCFEIASRFAAAGAHVTHFSARYPGAAPRGTRDGVRMLRGGGTYGVYAAAARHLLGHRHGYDAVIDFQNGIPFFSPLFTPRWTADICVIHHVHQSQFDLMLPRPLNIVGRMLEKQAGSAVYRGRPVVVVSPSTLEGTRRELGFHNPIYIVPNGSPPAATSDNPASTPRSDTPTLAVVSRLMPQKRIDLLVRAMPQLACRIPDLRLDIAGEGPELGALRDLAEDLGVADITHFHGHVSEEAKQRLLAGAWLTVVPSAAEGWGLTVIEANAAGTPTLAYDVPGLRDAVRPGHNGWLLPPEGDLADGVAAALETLAEPAARARAATRCRSWAAAFSWDDSAERLAAVVLEEIRRTRRHQRSRRRPSDLTVVGRFRAEDAEDAAATEAALERVLRQTDTWVRDGDRFHLLLHGCDEVRALRALHRLGVHAPELTLASRQDVLVGTSGLDGADGTEGADDLFPDRRRGFGGGTS
ncbi:glycosyltransferase family 4 protein [Streptomyces sp. NA04227]|uniref:glycosyltransferase family 4 protein n=1 Tax=Streptomyces sp. NA04227 TaxID=2742136 RepID=UPI0015929D91|nr:glycosyltransferase family 4 protein [Streptomyces sp. NA04227]QKW09734.1 glycosyltransferase family 4 protein [Streptomyces sp. NA04227]